MWLGRRCNRRTSPCGCALIHPREASKQTRRYLIHRSDAPIVKRRQLPVAVATWGLLLWAYGRGTGDARDQHSVDLPGDVALEAADDLSLALALRGAPRDVLLCATISAHPSQTDHLQRAVGFPVATAVETMAEDLAGGSLYGSHSTQTGEGGLAPQPLGVVPGRDQQCRGVVGIDSRQIDQLRGELRYQPIELCF